MLIATLLSLLTLVIAFITGNYWLVAIVPLFFITIKFANDELKSFIGEGASELFSTGYLFPLFAVVNQSFTIFMAVFLFTIIWILTIGSFLPNWKPSRKRLFLLGMITAVLMILQFYLFVAILPMIIVTLYKSRNSIKHIATLLSGFIWILLGILFTYPLLSHPQFDLSSKAITLSDPGLRYFLYFISVITALWTVYLYGVRRRWRPENRYLILNMVMIPLINLVLLRFDLLPTIVISLPVLHMSWNLQIKKSHFSIAFALAIVTLIWLNQHYVLNFLNLQ